MNMLTRTLCYRGISLLARFLGFGPHALRDTVLTEPGQALTLYHVPQVSMRDILATYKTKDLNTVNTGTGHQMHKSIYIYTHICM